MKIFKKAISLVLVFAMLASFAGMTGYKYSPMSIEAEAYTAGSRKTFYVGENKDIRIEMNSMLYKTKATAANTIVSSGNGNEVDDYIILAADNDLYLTITFPEWVTVFDGGLSVDPNAEAKNYGYLWSPLEKNAHNNGSACYIKREGTGSQTNDYGVLFGRTDDKTGYEHGFENVDYIYWSVRYADYTSNVTDNPDTTSDERKADINANADWHYATWKIPLVDVSNKGDTDGDAKQWSVPATEDKPTDSHAAENTMTWSVPKIIYLASNPGTVQASVNGITNDTLLSFTLPKGTKQYKFYIGSTAETMTQVHQSTTSAADLAKPVTLTDFDLKNFFGSNTYSYGIWYKIEYWMDVAHVDGITREVKYTQFAFTRTVVAPRYKVGYAVQANFENSKEGTWWEYLYRCDTFTTVFQEMNFLNFINQGFVISTFNKGPVTSAVNSNGVLDHGSRPAVNAWYENGEALPLEWNSNSKSWSKYDSANSKIRYHRSFMKEEATDNEREYGYFVPGYGHHESTNDINSTSDKRMGNNSTVAVGATIYYDKDAQKSSSVTAPLFTQFIDLYDNKGEANEYATIPSNTRGNHGWNYIFTTYSTTLSWKPNDLVSSTKNKATNLPNQEVKFSDGSWAPATNDSSSAKAQVTNDNIVFSPTSYDGTAKNYLMLLSTESYEYRDNRRDVWFFTELYYSYAFEFVPVTRTNANKIIELALANNYVEEEMDPTWWKSYMGHVNHAYRLLGDLSDTTDCSDAQVEFLENPKYVFANYGELNSAISKTADWDRGGLVADKNATAANATAKSGGYLAWGADYAEWNTNTYDGHDTDFGGDYSSTNKGTITKGKVDGRMAVYNLKFNNETKTLYIDTSSIRDGSYYYTADTWSKYEAARNSAAKTYNYPTGTAAFDYDTPYPAKTTSGTNPDIGLACYCQEDVIAAARQLNKARTALDKKDADTGYSIENVYKILIDAANIAYDGEKYTETTTIDGKTYEAGDPKTLTIEKQGYLIPSDENYNYYDSVNLTYDYSFRELQFRATHPDDVFDNIDDDGLVITNDDEQPLLKGSDTLLAMENGDTGILYFPYTGRPVGKGNTFTQLLFDNSRFSGNAVTNVRKAIGNRLYWNTGGSGDGNNDGIYDFTFLLTQKGAYNENIKGTGNSKDKPENERIYLTEDMLRTDPSKYMWTGVEHEDDILRCAYAMFRVNNTLRLATNYREVYEALNMVVKDANGNIIGNSKLPAYETAGTAYVEKNLGEVTMFYGYTPTDEWDQQSLGKIGGVEWSTTGKTWYTKESWEKFTAARDALAALIYDGSSNKTSLPISTADITALNEAEIGNTFSYSSGLQNKYYTYDAIDGGKPVTDLYTNGIYYNTAATSSNLAAVNQQHINDLVADYKTAMANLVPKNLDEYKWPAYSDKDVSGILSQVNTMYSIIMNDQQDVVWFYTDREDPDDPTSDIVGAHYKTESNPKYSEADIAQIEAKYALVTALNATGEDDLGDKAAQLNTALTDFNTTYIELVNKPKFVDTRHWNNFLNHLTELNGGTAVTVSNIGDWFGDASTYSNTDGVKDKVTTAAGATLTTQDDYNTALLTLYNLLNTEYTSAKVINAANEAIAEAGKTFIKYNPYDVANSTKPELLDPESDALGNTPEDGITIVLKYNDKGVVANANTEKGTKYKPLSTYVSDVTAAADKLKAQAGLITVSGVDCLLEDKGVQTDILDAAIAEATDALGVGGQAVADYPSDTSKKYSYDMYDQKTLAELQVVVKEANEVDTSNLTTADQLAIDKHIFALIEEMDNDRIVLAASTSAPYRSWDHSGDGLPTYTDDTDVFTEDNWNKWLRGTLTGKSGTNGLGKNKAYYELLKLEMKGNTIVTFGEDGEKFVDDSFIGVVWDENGNLLTDAGGTVIGSTIFDGDPEAVTGWYAYTAAIANAQAAITANNHTADQQDSVVDALAYAVYEARNALKARNFSANSVPYQEAIGYAATYEAMLVKLNITEYMVVDGEPSNNTSHTVDLYKNVDEEFVNMVTAFKATYAVPNNDTPYESTDAMRAAKAAIDRYIAGYRENDTEGNPSAAPIEIRTMADDEIKLGFVDLCNSFIAGTFTPGTFDDEGKYTDGTYTSSVISNGINDNTANQSAEIQAKLNELYKFQFVKSKNASTDLIGALNGATDILYTYLTETPATDLQFAVHMRDNELLYFLRAGIEGSVPFYYGGNGEYVIPLFNQNTVDQIEEDVNNFFDKLNKGTWELADGNQIGWPKIYEVNNITWNKAAAEAKEKREAVVITGYEGDTSTHTYTGDIVAVVEILNQVGACCLNYVTAAGNVNKFNLKPYEWLQKNAVSSTKAEETVVLAVNKKLGTNDPKAYETPDWYAGDNYAYFKDNDGNYYCADWFVDFNDTLGTFMSPKGEMKDTLAYAEEYNLDIWVVGDDKAEHYYEYLNEVAWSPSHLGKLKDWAGEYQSMYDGFAQEYYEAICALQLLPATDAYRDVYNTYLSVKGLHIDDGNWIDDSFSSGTTSNVDFKFYNLLDATQLSRIAGMYNKLYDDALPPYGTVLRASYNDFLNKYTQSNEYVANETNNPWYNMEQYIDDLIDGGAVITIDQAEKVNTYNKDDNIPSIMETLVDVYLSKLEFDDLVYDNLDAVVKAFLGDNLSNGLADIKEKLEAKGFTVGGNYGGQFYELNYYTNESLLQVAGILRSQNVLASNKIIEQEIGEVDKYYWVGETFPLPIEFDISYKGTFYTSTTDQKRIDSSKEEDHSVLLAFLTALNTKLELKPVDTDGYKNSVGADIPGIEQAIAAGNLIVETKAKYDTGDTSWDAFVTELEKAENLFAQASTYNITDQDMFDQQASDLYTAINNLKLRADDYAPQMTLKTSVSAVEEFYSHPAYEVALNQKDSVSYTVTQADGKTTYDAHPAAGTFFIPNSSGYSLIVYTNELNPRIVINLEDLEKVLEEGTNDSEAVVQDAAKKEYISINAKKTSGVETNVIAGTIVHDKNNSANNTMDITASGIANGTAAIGVENNTGKTNSSAFAILAPKFVDGKTTQAAVYTIEARDGSARSTDTGTIAGNPAEQFDFGGDQKPIDIVRDNNGKIAIYIYYYSLKAKDGTDEGINATGTALAEPAISGTNVPYTLLSGEPGFEGKDWRNGILLQRHFSDSHRVWEYVSEVKKNADGQYNVNGAQVPVYNDPTFGYLNTGSFYYVLDDEADADIITAYHTAKSSSTTAGCMDYAAATVAKTAMISAINAANATKLSEMKASGRFYNYGDYYTDANGKVLYNGEEPQWVNWAQAIGGKVDNGDLVFVHVVDRWGNVVNRIVEITNLDKSSPEVNTATAGTVTINEAGGSGLADIQVHNGDFSLGEFEYEVNTEQKPLENPQITNKATVECANNKLTIKGLVPGKTYLIGAEDKAGNRSTTAVKADTNGYIVITIDNEIVQTGEDMGFEGNSSTFTLNGTDTIILNAGEASSVINASIEGNVFANRYIKHYVTTTDSVTALKTVYQDGTAEEFTAEKTVVTVNGDGTLTWEIRRKLAEGEHKYKVYAKVNGEYESFFATATINATNKKVRFECTNVGQGAIQLFYSGALYTQDVSNYISTDIPYGAKVTVAAKAYTAYEGCEFYYWINNITDRIINTADVYEFKAVSNVDYIAQFTNNSTCIDGKKFVVYVNNAKNVVERFELADGETYTVPTGPVLPDYTFKGWSMTKAEVLASDKDTIIVEPIYELNASNTVTITEGNYTATGAGTYTAEDNQRAVVTISTDAKDGDGKEFLYWIDADTDEIVSYDRTYSFFCVKDTQLTPVYGDASTVTAEPIVRITEVKFNALSGKVSFFAERSVPEEFVILQTGIVVTKTESIGTNEEVFVVGGTSTAAGTSTSTANNGYYSANAAVATGQTVWARAYVIYETADGEILEAYGPVVSYTVD